MRGDARFVTAAARPRGYPPPVGPEVVLMGRSNVGKSSLLNALLGRRRLARVSRTPGRTQQLNFFHADGLGTLVDLPGYGYARAPVALRRSWKPLVEGYLESERPVAICLLLLDARREPSPLDRQLMEWLRSRQLPTQTVLTKADAVAGSALRQRMERIVDSFGLDPEAAPIPVSARTGQGVRRLRAIVHRAVSR